ncbi:MAG: hypothetical protein FJ098_08645, partial [Deltaproteobacteria bacterium]|nr:hypothetical protein [Deltaproteobacteria bacterium]
NDGCGGSCGTCQDGACVGGEFHSGQFCDQGHCKPTTMVSCDDTNPCTQDGCLPLVGCTHVPADSLPCEDGDPCTVSDICQNGACAPGAGALSCSDGKECTQDLCVPFSGCAYPAIPNGTPCGLLPGGACQDGACVCIPQCQGRVCGDDGCGGSCGTCPGQACVGKEFHVDIFCDVDGFCKAGVQLPCDDTNPCTDDSCNPQTGCVYTNATLPCDDGDPCTQGERCSFGTCQGGVPMVCADDNPCTTDVCIPGLGCQSQSVPNGEPCIDGMPFWTCMGGVCICIPDCTGRVCGPDGCGGECGTCVGGMGICTITGQCI